MSVMQKLRAIRERITTQAEEAQAAEEAESHHNVHPLHTTPNPAPTATPEPQATASMWDLVHDDTDDFEDDLDLPQPDKAVHAESIPAAAAERAPAPAAASTPALKIEPHPESTPLAADSGSAEVTLQEQPDDRSQRRPGRVKTRLLGFEHSSGKSVDLAEKAELVASGRVVKFPVGWLVIVEGPGLGASIPVLSGVSQIGRDEDQAVQLDFGDTSISRTNHAAVAYDEEERAFFIGHGGKSNLVRLNGKPLLSTERVNHGNTIRIGETTLRLVALCGEHFSWADLENSQKTANL